MYCPKCGGTNTPAAQFCEHCGNPLRGNPSQPVQTSQPILSQQPPTPTPSVMQPSQAIPVTQPSPHATVEMASPLARFFAFLIDGIVGTIVVILALLAFSPFTSKAITDYEVKASEGFSAFFVSFLPLTVFFFVAMFLVYVMQLLLPAFFGATIGKMLLKIRIVDNHYQPVGYLKIFLRELVGKIVSSMIMYIGYIAIIFDSENRGWHDRIAGTYVIKRKEGIHFNRQPILPTIVLILIIVLFSFVTSVVIAALTYYGVQGEAKEKALYKDLETFFDNDKKIDQETTSVSGVIENSLKLERGNLAQLEKYEIQIKDVGERLDSITSDSKYNLAVLKRAKDNLDDGNYYKSELDTFFRDMEEGQRLLNDTLDEYIIVWKKYEKPIGAIFTIARNDARLIQIEKNYAAQSAVSEGSNTINPITFANLAAKDGVEISKIRQEIEDAKQTLIAVEEAVRLTPLLLEVVENEVNIAKTFEEISLASPANSAGITTLILKHDSYARYLGENSILSAYKAWVEVEVSPHLTQFDTQFKKAYQKIDSAFNYYRKNISKESASTDSSYDANYQYSYPSPTATQ